MQSTFKRNQDLSLVAADRDIALQSIALIVSRIPQCKVPKTEKVILSDNAMDHILLQPKNKFFCIRHDFI